MDNILTELHPGDWVKTDTELKGRIVHVGQLSVFVEVQFVGGVELLPFPVNELTKVDPPIPPAVADA